MGNTLSISAVQLPTIPDEPLQGGDMAIVGINPSLSSIGIYNDYGRENTISSIGSVGEGLVSDRTTLSLNLSSTGLSALMWYNSRFDMPSPIDNGWSFACWFKVYPDTPHSTSKRQIAGYGTSIYASVSSESDGSNPILHTSSHLGDYTGTPGDISYDQWHHLTITRDPGVDEDVKVYLDGTLKHTQKSNYTSVTYMRDIGQRLGYTYNDRLHGALYSITQWGFVLQQNDITTLQTTSVEDMTISPTYSASPRYNFQAGSNSIFTDAPRFSDGHGIIYIQDFTASTNQLIVVQSNQYINQINIPIYVEDKPNFS